MTDDHKAEDRQTKLDFSKIDHADHHRVPARIALAVALFGIAAMAVVDHGPWNKPNVQTAEVHTYTTTGESARAIGATVTNTEQPLDVEPVPAGPKRINPAAPSQVN